MAKWASGTDRILAGSRFIALFGELDVPDAPVLDGALAAIAAAGVHTRVALQLQSRRRLWRHTPEALPAVRVLPDDVARGGSAAILHHIRRRSGPPGPVEVHISRRHVALDVDHGIGDGRFALELLSALFAHSGGSTSDWVSRADTRLALPRALARTFGRHPTRVPAALRQASGALSAQAVDLQADQVAWAPSLGAAVAHIPAEVEAEVDRWRRSRPGRCGSAAFWLYILRQAFRAARLSVADRMMVAFDCRRYLASSEAVSSNFIIGLYTRCADDDDVAAIGARIRNMTAAAVPLAGMAMVSARGLLPLRRSERPQSRRSGLPVNVMYTDLGSIEMPEHVLWKSCGERYLVGLLDPAGPNAITVLNTRMGAARHISISFHDNVVDRAVVDEVVGHLTDPMRLLRG